MAGHLTDRVDVGVAAAEEVIDLHATCGGVAAECFRRPDVSAQCCGPSTNKRTYELIAVTPMKTNEKNKP